MQDFSYARLSSIVDSEPPIRGTQLYPVYGRRSTDRFAMVDEDNQKVFHVYHGTWWKRDEITKEQAESGKYPEGEVERSTNWYNKGEQWWHTRRVLHHVLTVRPDNTAEIVVDTDYLCQGDRSFLTRSCGGYIFSNVKLGGVVYKTTMAGMETTFPLVKNMRLTCEYFPKPVGNYQIFGRRVSRRDAKETLKKYEDFYNTVEAMMKVMPIEVFRDIAIDALKAKNVDIDRYWISKREKEGSLKQFDTMIAESPIDAAAFYCAMLDIEGFWHKVRSPEWTPSAHKQYPTQDMFDSLYRQTKRHIYETHRDVMTQTELKFGGRLPESTWGYFITLDGKPVHQYHA